MSQPPNVLVSVGTGLDPKIPQQDYPNLFTKYNIGGIPQVSDSQFFNNVANNPITKEGEACDILGFMGSDHKYTFNYSVSNIVNFFEKYDFVGIVVCDMLIQKKHYKVEKYIQPQAVNDIPFFIKASLAPQIKFGEEPILQQQLETLKAGGHAIFHIAEPLLSLTGSD